MQIFIQFLLIVNTKKDKHYFDNLTPVFKILKYQSKIYPLIFSNRFNQKGVEPIGFDCSAFSGPDGSRTRVRSPIPCTSTSLVYRLTFPPASGDRHPNTFSSFIIRPHTQSLACVVSYLVDARFSKNRYKESDSCN